MGSRRQGRVIAFQSLYRYDISGAELRELLDFSWIDKPKLIRIPEDAIAFARLIITGTIQNINVIDKTIQNQLEHWDISRLARVDLAILRISVYCLLYQPDIPSTVTIDEAIDIGRDYGTDESYRFINGVLDGINKSR
ncbi:MAG: transcription antitermination factor NusB [Spirochaetes bacterium]|nr:MAG: transcription antitermination factor NusB [Spirochaetota bacterium]